MNSPTTYSALFFDQVTALTFASNPLFFNEFAVSISRTPVLIEPDEDSRRGPLILSYCQLLFVWLSSCTTLLLVLINGGQSGARRPTQTAVLVPPEFAILGITLSKLHSSLSLSRANCVH